MDVSLILDLEIRASGSSHNAVFHTVADGDGKNNNIGNILDTSN